MWCARKQMGGLHILVGICIHLVCGSINIAVDHSNPSPVYYYDVKDGKPLDGSVQEAVGSDQRRSERISFRSNGCSCQTMTCGCCTGINIQQFNFHREGCMNFTYDPLEFSIMMNMFMDNNVVYSNSVSAKNPPPLCLPFDVPYLPSVAFCAKLFDVHTPGQNLQMCLDFETRVQQAPVLVLHFNCMRLGFQGFALVKPGDSPHMNVTIVDAGNIGGTTTEDTVTDVDIYDEVTEGKFVAV